jgi:UDP-glucose 4-epimerase
VKGFVNVAEQARSSGCDTKVYASAAAVYGTLDDPVSEEADISAPNAKSASKLARGSYADYLTTAYDMTLAGMRFFSV